MYQSHDVRRRQSERHQVGQFDGCAGGVEASDQDECPVAVLARNTRLVLRCHASKSVLAVPE